MIDAAFAQRRKTLRAALAGWAGSAAGRSAACAAGVDPTARGEVIDIAAFARIAEVRPSASRSARTDGGTAMSRTRSGPRQGAGKDQRLLPAWAAAAGWLPLGGQRLPGGVPVRGGHRHGPRRRRRSPSASCAMSTAWTSTDGHPAGRNATWRTRRAAMMADVSEHPHRRAPGHHQARARSPAAWAAARPTPPPPWWPATRCGTPGCSRDELLELAAELGADVPFALLGGTAVGLGVGDRLDAGAGAQAQMHWVLVPAAFGLSTPEVYPYADRLRPDAAACRPSPSRWSRRSCRRCAAATSDALAGYCTTTCRRRPSNWHPSLRDILELGEAAARCAGIVSGSGPTVAFLTRSPAGAAELAQRLSDVAGVVALPVHGPVHGARIMADVRFRRWPATVRLAQPHKQQKAATRGPPARRREPQRSPLPPAPSSIGVPRTRRGRPDRHGRPQRRRQVHADAAARRRAARPTPAGSPSAATSTSATWTRATCSTATAPSARAIVGDARRPRVGRATRRSATSWTGCVGRRRLARRRSHALSGGQKRRGARWPSCCSTTTTCWCSTSRPTTSTSRASPGWPRHLARWRARRAFVVVTHDRWFLDAVCTATWEVARRHRRPVRRRLRGLRAGPRRARPHRAAAMESKRQQLVRKELAWLRRGPPARTSKPKFRIEAANALIADEPEPRDSMALSKMATARLGKDVLDLRTRLAGLPRRRRRAEALRQRHLAAGPGRTARPRRRQRRRQDHPAEAAQRRDPADLRQGQARQDGASPPC